MRKMIPPLPDNSWARAEKGLASDWLTLRDRAIFRELANVMLANWTPGPVKVAEFSSSGFPLHTRQAEAKIAAYREAIPHLEEIVSLASSRNLLDLYRRHKLLVCYRMQVRKQADSFKLDKASGKYKAKHREFPNLEFALTNGERGNIIPADRTCEWNDQLVLARLRTVYGLSNTVNLLIASCFEGHNVSLFKRFPDTFKHRGASDIARKLNRWRYHVAADVGNHDFLVPKFVMRLGFDALREIWDDRVVDFIELAWQAPCYVPNLNVYEEPDPFWLGHPLNPQDFNHWYGIPSGHFLVSWAGKFGCMGVYLCKLDRIGVDVLGHVEEILSFKHPQVGILNLGDDSVVCFNDPSLHARYSSELDEQHYYATGVEPLSFLGNAIFKDRPEDQNVRVCNNPVSYLTNRLVAERALGSWFKEYWVIGHYAREQVYSTMPCYGQLRESFERAFRDEMGYDFEHAVNSHPDAKMSVEAQSEADLLTLASPDRLQYRFELSDVSDEIASKFVKKIDPDEYLDYVTPLMKG